LVRGAIGLSIVVGGGFNIGTVSSQASQTKLLNKVKPTNQSSIMDCVTNAMAPIPSAISNSLF
jgi:hypothetical protein